MTLREQNNASVWAPCDWRAHPLKHRWVATHRSNVQRCARCPQLRIVEVKR